MTDLRPDDSYRSGERDLLLWFLDEYRRVLARKAEGITDEQARAAASPPSDLTLLGLIRHMAKVERVWFRERLGREDVPRLYVGALHPTGDPDGDFHAPADATLAEAFESYWREIAAADRIIAATELDTDVDTARGRISLRWILVHMIEEYARHCGHADLVRQAVDGATGD
jgi:uncharacterized damage-inducible protein DinB